ncbi:MAG: hypothetical protein H6718_07835 [Polyangiaceae bacterium]|nr:hypothetical protein [Myxococcales bacterium]MCB9585292.1 hypothetical protein [Polyangiaceae bacterium]MCB9606691.1 hypothetical protein [Polyangiaceae bacterium]
MKLFAPLAILGCALGVVGGCSSSTPEEARVGACDGQSTCTVEELCAVAKCGGAATARFNADGCIRRNCTASSQCATGEVCFLPGLVENTCLPSGRSCEIYEGRCTCGGTADCGGGGLCVPEAEIPEDTCVVPDDCNSLKDRIENLEYSKFHGVFTPEEDVALQVDSCLTEMRKRQIELACNNAPCAAQVSCSKESVCASETCGGPTARFDSEGCARQPCEQSSDCEGDQVCFLPALVADTCVASNVESCTEEDGTCNCSKSADCSGSGFCIAPSEVPTEDCVVPSDCDALKNRYDQLQQAATTAQSDLTDRITACIASVESKRQELNCQ